MEPPPAVTDRAGALAATYAWFERHSGWAPPDEEDLAEWAAEGLARCPDDCVVAHDGWCAHGLASWWLVAADLADGGPGPHRRPPRGRQKS